jgi:hypothetical protein
MKSVKKLATSRGARDAIERHEARGARFGFLKERLSRINLEEYWGALEDGLSLGDGRKNPEKVARALDECDSNLRRAGMVLQAAIEELDEFDIHYRAAYAEWEAHARETLENRKKDKRHSGMVTNDLVENWIARYVDDYRRWKKARRSLARSKTLSKQMFAAWESRSASLRKQADLIMSRRGVDPKALDRRPRRRRGEGESDGQE